MRTRTFTVYVAANRAQVWRALTDPECTRRFYLGLAVEADWRDDGEIAYRAPDAPDWAELAGHIVHIRHGHLLVHSIDETTAWGTAPESWVTWKVDELAPRLCRIALTSDDLDAIGAAERDDAWNSVLSGLKTVLETGRALQY